MQGHATWRAVRVRGLIVMVAMMAGAVIGVGVTESSEESYTASADVFVTAKGTSSPAEAAEVAQFSQQEATNFAGLVTRDVVLQPVIDDLGLDMTPSQLSDQVSATVPLDTSIISISTSDTSARGAAQVANAVAASLTQVVEELTSASLPSGAPVALRSIEKATAPSSPTTPRPLLNVVIGLLAGLCLGVAVIAVGDAFRSSQQA